MSNQGSNKIDEAKFMRKTETEIKNYEILRKAFEKIYENEKTLSEKRTGSFIELGKIRETDNSVLSNIYQNFQNEMKQLEDFRKKQMEKILKKFIPATKYFTYNAKNYKQKIGKYKDKIKENEKQHYEMNKATESRNELKASQLLDDIKKSQVEINTTGKELKSDIIKFEKERLENNKYLLLHFIHSEMAYHGESLDKLTKLYESINSLQPESCFKDFFDKYKLGVDPSDYGYDERKFKNSSIRQSYLNKSKTEDRSFNKSIKQSKLSQSKNESIRDSRVSNVSDNLGDEIES